MIFFRKPKPVLTPLESALLQSLTSEPNKWHVSSRSDPLTLVNREKGAAVAWTQDRAFSGKLVFSADFHSAWGVPAWALALRLEAEADAAAATSTRLQMERAFGL